jgi:hypothetical protein
LIEVDAGGDGGVEVRFVESFIGGNRRARDQSESDPANYTHRPEKLAQTAWSAAACRRLEGGSELPHSKS